MTTPITRYLDGDLLEVLDNVLEFLDDRMDVKDGSYGVPTPNREMALHTELAPVVERLKRSIAQRIIESTDERKIERIIRVLKAAKPAVSAKMDHRALASGILMAITEQP